MIEVVVESKGKTDIIKAERGSNLLQVLRENEIYVPALCNGNGTCGKCKVKLRQNIEATEADKKFLSFAQRQEGYRLACKAVADKDMYVFLSDGEEDMVIETGSQSIPQWKEQAAEASQKAGKPEEQAVEASQNAGKPEEQAGEVSQNAGKSEEKVGEARQNTEKSGEKTVEAMGEEQELFIAVDIGTTTIAMALVDYQWGKILDVYTCLNHQRVFGADVISRITASNSGKNHELKHLIEEDLLKGIRRLAKSGDEKNLTSCLKKVVIAGNTTMVHLLMGYSCESLGHHPFHSEHLSQFDGSLQDCITGRDLKELSLSHVKLMIFPGVSAFVGGDIVAGIQICHEFDSEELTFLLDLGTNGEMVFGNKECILCTSAAAGPAFEGGNITCGTGSIPGAVSMVKIQNRRAVVRTIEGSDKVTGICGTGIVSAIAQLKLTGLMDLEGKLKFPYERRGFPLHITQAGETIALYQQDIRQFQMAKGAIRTGVEQLIEAYGCKFEDVRKVYLAGGFGTRLSVEDAIETGILPKQFAGKVEGIGNGALYGAIFYERQKDKKDLNALSRKIQNISLAQSEDFQKKYLINMNFS